MTRRFLLTIPAPAGLIRSNQHGHWSQRHELTKLWRTAAAWESRRQHLPALGLGPVHITATFHREDNRRYDLDGAAPTVKACIDGMRDAGVLAEDHCGVIPLLTIAAGEPWADAALVITITTIDKEQAS